MNFDMNRIGRTIAKLRRDSNMTQMQLADTLDVSFQAVSNWERGRSMPDISKLPELAELFSVTIDELLNCRSVIIEKAAYGKLDEHLEELEKTGESITVEEVADAAPILQPKQLEKIADRLIEPVENGDDDNMQDAKELLPFVSQEKADMLFRRQMEKDPNVLNEFAPFVSEELIDETAVKLEEQDAFMDNLLPFMSETAIMEIVRARRDAGKSFRSLLPFMQDEEIMKIALDMEEKSKSINSLLPFLDTETINEIARKRRSTGIDFIELLPFMDKKATDELALQVEYSGRYIMNMIPFVSGDTVKVIIINRIKNRRSFKELLPFAPEDFLDCLADEAANK